MVSINLAEFERGAPFSGDADAALAALSDRLSRLQLAQIVHRRRAIVLIEGWTGSGKRAALRRLTGAWDPCSARVHNIGADDRQDADRHWLAPFWGALPAAGETSIFYRSWYRLPINQRLSGRFDERRWTRACDEINEFEAQQRDHGTLLIKLFFHVSAEVQRARFEALQADPWTRHLLTQAEVEGLDEREQTEALLNDMFTQTNTRWAPWTVIDGNDQRAGEITALEAIVDQLAEALPEEPPASDDAGILLLGKKRLSA